MPENKRRIIRLNHRNQIVRGMRKKQNNQKAKHKHVTVCLRGDFNIANTSNTNYHSGALPTTKKYSLQIFSIIVKNDVCKKKNVCAVPARRSQQRRLEEAASVGARPATHVKEAHPRVAAAAGPRAAGRLVVRRGHPPRAAARRSPRRHRAARSCAGTCSTNERGAAA